MGVVCLNWENAHLYGETWISHHRLRHRLFVERQGWDVPSHNGLEHDEFDTPAAQYLLWLDEHNETRGVARLIPTTRPYMVEKLWPDLVPGPLPASKTVWEATRFGCDRTLDARTRRRAVAEILCALHEFGLEHGIKRYLAVMPVRLFKSVVIKAGCQVSMLGRVKELSGLPTTAGYLSVSHGVLQEMRRRGSIAGSVFRRDMAAAA